MVIGYDIRAIIGKPILGSQAPAGVAGYVVHLLRELVIQGENHEFILFANAFKKPDLSLIEDILELPNVSLVTTRLPNKLFDHAAKFFNYPRIDSLIKKHTGKRVSIYFTPHINITPLSKDVRYALTVHDVSFDLYHSFYALRKQYWHFVQDPQKACSRADIIFTVSKHTKQDIQSTYNISPDNVHAVYPGVLFSTKRKELSVAYNLPQKYILYIGTLEPRKNIEGIIEAFTIFKKQTKDTNTHLVLGGGKGWLYSRIYKTAQKSRYKDQIHFLGYVDEADKATLIKNAEAFVFPSFYEGFGFPPLEALAQGTPVVASHVSSLPEVVSKEAILVDPYNSYDIARGIYEALCTDPVENSDKAYNWATTGEHIMAHLIQ